MEFGSVPPGLPRINWLTPTPPLPFDSASEDAKAPEMDWLELLKKKRSKGLTPFEEICRSSALCLGSGEVPNNGWESWKTVPPGRTASLTFADRSIGLPTTPNINEEAYKV